MKRTLAALAAGIVGAICGALIVAAILLVRTVTGHELSNGSGEVWGQVFDLLVRYGAIPGFILGVLKAAWTSSKRALRQSQSSEDQVI